MISHLKNILIATILGFVSTIYIYYATKPLAYFIAAPKTGSDLIWAFVEMFGTVFIVSFIILEAIRFFRIFRIIRKK